MKWYDHSAARLVEMYVVSCELKLPDDFSREEKLFMNEIYILHNLLMNYWRTKDRSSYTNIHLILLRKERAIERVLMKIESTHHEAPHLLESVCC